MSYALDVKAACGFDTSRPVIIAGNGPSLLGLDDLQLPDDAYVFRCNWFFLEDHYRLGRRVDGYFWSVHNEGMLRGLEEAGRTGGYQIRSYFTPVVLKESGDATSFYSTDAFKPIHNHWRIIAGKPELAASMMMRPLPTQGMQMLATALELGFRDIHLVGIDFYQDPSSRYAWQVPPSIADLWLMTKDLNPGYESSHDISVDLRMLQYSLDAYPDATIRNLGCDNPILPRCTRNPGTGVPWFEPKDPFETVPSTRGGRRFYKELKPEGAAESLKCAYVTYAGGCSPHAVAALANSLAKVTDLPLIVMVPPGTHTGLFPALGNLRVLFVERIPGPGRTRNGGGGSEDGFSKLNVFRLDFLDRAVFIAPDALVLKNIDHLFSHSRFAAAPDFGFEQKRAAFDTGVFVCTPSKDLHADLLRKLARTSAAGEREFLNECFAGAEHLDRGYNTLKQVTISFPETFNLENVSVLNLTGVEPHYLFEPDNEPNYKSLTGLWFSFLPDESKIALLHEFRAALTGECAFNVRVAHKHFEIDGVVPQSIRDVEALELKPIEMARALMAVGRHDIARTLSEACLRKNPDSKSHQQILQECARPSAKSPGAKNGEA